MFGPDGGAGPKVTESLKSLGIVLRGPRRSALHLMEICRAAVERSSTKLPPHTRTGAAETNIYTTLVLGSCLRRGDEGVGVLPNCSSHNSVVCVSQRRVSQAGALTDGLSKTAHLDTNKEPPMI